MWLTILLLLSSDWPQFRGVNGSGVSDSTGIPVKFGPKKNVVWKTVAPQGHSSPVLTESRIFLTGFEKERLLTLCIDRATGTTLWTREAPRPRKQYFQPTNGPASPSPVTDGTNVYVYFGDFGLISYTSEGEERWRLPLGPFNNVNGIGSSPILTGKILVLLCDQDTDSYLLAVDAATGKVRWRTMRPDSTRGYATPVVYQPKDGPAEVIVPGAFQVVSYSLSTGERLWWVRGMSWQLKSVPVIDDGVVYVNGWEAGLDTDKPREVPTWEETLAKYDTNHDGKLSADESPWKNRKSFIDADLNQDDIIDERDWNFYRARATGLNNVVAIRAGGHGDVTGTHVLWRFRKSVPNVPSPLLYRGVLFLVKEGGILTSLDPKTGEIYKQARLTEALGQYWSSPVAADGRIYVASEDGKISVIKAAAQWEVLTVNDLEEEIFATPAIADGDIFVRTRGMLYRFGSSPK